MQPLTGSIKRYDWGSVDAIPRLLGIPVDGQPVAEYWLGAHPLGVSQLNGGTALDKAIESDPSMIGDSARHEFGGRLPYLVKLLSAARPLSLQAHPNLADAQAGYERENRVQLPIDSPERTYRDPWDKPELIIALTQFEALAGFRDPKVTADLLSRLGIARTPKRCSPRCGTAHRRRPGRGLPGLPGARRGASWCGHRRGHRRRPPSRRPR